MLRKVVSKPEISRLENRTFQKPGRYFFVTWDGWNRHHNGPCWMLRVFTDPYSNKGYRAGQWRTKLIVSADDFDELLEHTLSVLVTRMFFLRVSLLREGGRERLFVSEREAFAAFDAAEQPKSLDIHDVWYDSLEETRPNIIMPGAKTE